ncbi:hypothetical protein ElyMa_002300600 [Elysia marginata]|uniref:Uncharacterized protein n=1 Tax=Elysia marginata TaxID=1093978 RepID=A0AAV4G308_9GAST|nr:hypothetical protein ElyMa_002300600 [Elysia marginata]
MLEAYILTTAMMMNDDDEDGDVDDDDDDDDNDDDNDDDDDDDDDDNDDDNDYDDDGDDDEINPNLKQCLQLTPSVHSSTSDTSAESGIKHKRWRTLQHGSWTAQMIVLVGLTLHWR